MAAELPESWLARNIGVAQGRVVKNRSQTQEAAARLSAEFSHAHRGDGKGAGVFLKEGKEPGELCGAVRASGDFENVGAISDRVV